MTRGMDMKNIIIYKGIACLCLGTIFVTGCVQENPSQNVQKKDVIESSSPTTIHSNNQIIFVTKLRQPTTEEELEIIKQEIDKTSPDTIFVFTNSLESKYTREMVEYALEAKPELQFYAILDKQGENIFQNYPNVTEVETEDLLSDTIQKQYTSNEICSRLIEDFRMATDYGTKKIDDFDMDKSIEMIKKTYQNIDTEEILLGIEKFYQYVSATELFKQVEKLNEQAMQYMEPYVAKAIPIIEEKYALYKPKVEEKIEKGKTKIKSWLES